MTAKQLKEKYPELWQSVYTSMINDLICLMLDMDVRRYEECLENRLEKIAYNAAFYACNEYHKRVK